MCHQQWAYKYQSVRRWSKNIPGKNIFALDRIFFPINRGCMYWMCAVIFMQKKKWINFLIVWVLMESAILPGCLIPVPQR